MMAAAVITTSLPSMAVFATDGETLEVATAETDSTTTTESAETDQGAAANG